MNDDRIVAAVRVIAICAAFRVIAICILIGLVIGILQYSRQLLAGIQQILEVLP